MSETNYIRELPLVPTTVKLSTELKTGSWRVQKPIINSEKCVKCLLCWVYCPESSIRWDGASVIIDYNFCKGCGICSRECPVKAIEMFPER
ncbi:MAG: 4Fe-4S binding protein [Sulfolobales archaeon]